jgi:hypothetical protein
VLWAADEPLNDAEMTWRRLVDAFPRTGLWPVILQSLHGYPDRPWDKGEFDGPEQADLRTADPHAVLADLWSMVIPLDEEDEDQHLEPFGSRFPGLAPATDRAVPGRALDHAFKSFGAARLGLVPVTRPADIVAVLGWQGAINHQEPGDLRRWSVVLRSWEDRFGAMLVALGFDTMLLVAQRPPTDLSQALLVAAEHYAFCSDNVDQAGMNLREYAEGLRLSRLS